MRTQEDYRKDILANNEFDNLGVFTDPFDENATKYNLPKMMRYCDANNKKAVDLTDEEREMFVAK